MLRRNLLIAVVLLLFSLNCYSQFYTMPRHEIEISLDIQGNAEVAERFFLQFQSQQQLSDFMGKVREIGVSLEGWRTYDARLSPSVGKEGSVVASKVEFVEEEETYLEMSYELNTPLVSKSAETSRMVEYNIRQNMFNSFLSGSLWVIPEGAFITVHLPPGAELQPPVEPQAEVSGNTITWSGYKYFNKLTLRYRVFKQIASFDFGKLAQQLTQSDVFWVVVAGVVAFSLLLLWKRKPIAARVEDYIVEHSDLSRAEGEEE